MNHIQIIDLHMHTTVSDGTDTPQQIIEKVQAAGIQLFSVTDHDAIEGALTIQEQLPKRFPELKFLRGVELSCRDENGKYHILGYQYQTEKGNLKDLIEDAHGLRMKKVAARLDFLKEEFGFVFSDQDLNALMRNHNPGKPHIAKLMVAYGYAESVNDAMQRFLNKKKFPNDYIRPETAIRAIIESGGIPVLAHPAYGDGDQLILGEEMDQRIRHLMEFGIQGMECYYSTFTPKIIQQMLEFADHYQMYVTAGSDYHGSNKLVRLSDTNLPSVEEGAKGLKAFLDAVL